MPHEVVRSEDGKLTFLLPELPDEDYPYRAAAEKLRGEVAKHIANKNAGAITQSSSLRPYVNGRMRLPRGPENDWKPAPFAVGDWIEWTPSDASEPLTGCIWSPGPRANTWFVWADRSVVTGEYHLLARHRRPDGSYSYSMSGGAVPRSLGRNVPAPEHVDESEALPSGATIPAKPITYEQWRGEGFDFPKPPLDVTMHHRQAPRGGPLPFIDVTVNGDEYVLRLDRARNGVEIFHVSRPNAEGELEDVSNGHESRAAAVNWCVQHHRENHAAYEVSGDQTEMKVTVERLRGERVSLDFWAIVVNGEEYTAAWNGPGQDTFKVNHGGVADSGLLLGEVATLADAKDLCARHATGERTGMLTRVSTTERGWLFPVDQDAVYRVTPTDDWPETYYLAFGDHKLGHFTTLTELQNAAYDHHETRAHEIRNEDQPVAEPAADDVPLFELTESAAEPGKPQVRVRRSFSAAEVKRRWAEGKRDPLWRRPPRTLSGNWPDPKTPRLERAQARLDFESASEHNADNAELTPLARFLIGRSATKWYVYHCASGLLMNQGAGFPSKRAALAWGTSLEQVKNADGQWFEWDIPYLGDELRLHESREVLDALIAGPTAPVPHRQTSETVSPESSIPAEHPAANGTVDGAATAQGGPDSVAGLVKEPQPAEAGAVAEHVPAILPPGALAIEAVPGYHYTRTGQQTTVYDPKNEPVAVGEYTKLGTTAGLVNGVRIPSAGYGSANFPALAAAQHRAAHLPAEQRDRVWVEIVPDGAARAGFVVAVRGTAKEDASDERATKAGNFLWSGEKKARVSGRAWTPRKVDENFAAVLSEFARQGRAIVVRREGDNEPLPGDLPGDLADAAPAVAAPTVLTESSAPDMPGAQAPGPQRTLDEVREEITRLEQKSGQYGSRAYWEMVHKRAPLQNERDRLVREELPNHPAPETLTEEEWKGEIAQLERLRGQAKYTAVQPEKTVLDERLNRLKADEVRRLAATLDGLPPVQELDDEELREEWSRLNHQGNYGDFEVEEARAAVRARAEAALEEMAARRVRETESRPAVAEMTVEDLRAELTADDGLRKRWETGKHPAVVAVEEARKAAVAEALNGHDEQLHAAALARVQVSENAGYVSIDGAQDHYGQVQETGGQWTHTKINHWERNRNGSGTKFRSRAEAIADLVARYDRDERTEGRRTWGHPQGVYVTSAFPKLYEERLGSHSETSASKEHQHLYDLISRKARYNGTSHFRSPLTGESLRGHLLEVPEGLLAEFQRITEGLSTRLTQQANNKALDKSDRDRAKRQLKAVGIALHTIEAARERVRVSGGNDDRKVIDKSQIEAELAALRGSLAEGLQDEGERDEPVRAAGAEALGEVPADRAGTDGGPGDLLHRPGAADRAADRGAGGESGAGVPGEGDLRGADRSAEPDPGRREGPGAAGDAAGAGGRGGAGGDGPADGDAGRTLAGPAPALTGGRFVPNPADMPRGPLDRARANLAAIKVLKDLQHRARQLTAEEQRTLARWSGWGSVPLLFAEEPDEKSPLYATGGERAGRFQQDYQRWAEYSAVRGELDQVLDPFEWRDAANSTLSAHYTPQSVASAMWHAVERLGFAGGEVLEAGSGSGTFFALAPESARLTGIELDRTTAQLSKRLYPDANVLNESFEATDAPAATFDMAIGNVPFAQVPFVDNRFAAGGYSLHNGFIIKDLALVRPGGIVVVITSRWTLDAENASARTHMATYGDLLGAVRLPSGTFDSTANTNVVADVLVFRRRASDQKPGDLTWLRSTEQTVNSSAQQVNQYFIDHPENVLGELTTVSGPHGPTLAVKGDAAAAGAALESALTGIVEQAVAAGQSYEEHPEGPNRRPLYLQTARDKHATDWSGRLYRDDEGRIWQHTNGADPVEAIPSDQRTDQLEQLMGLITVASELRRLDRADTEDERAEELRAQLRELHVAYTATYGPLSAPGQHRLGVHPDAKARDGADAPSTPTAWGWFKADPQAGTVLALERWNSHTGQPALSEVLQRRPGTIRQKLERTDDPKVALAAVMGATGQVDLPEIARLLGTDDDTARQTLGTEVFDNPATNRLEHAGAYLSGAVRDKLDLAIAAAATDPKYAANVSALRAVQPRQRQLGDFTVQLGASWVPPELVQGFLREYLGDLTLRVEHTPYYGWSIYASKVPESRDALHGTPRVSALKIAQKILGNSDLTVYDVEISDNGKTHRTANDDATRAVRQKADAMRSAFEAYVTGTRERAALIVNSFNRAMNGHVVRNYDGLSPTLNGLTTERDPHAHQLAAAARMQHERSVILAHEVGLGKTTTMVLGAMALKQSQQVTKPVAVVPNHLAQQWYDEASFLYPNAEIILITSDDLAGDRRRTTLEYLRSNTPDLVIFTEPAFTSVRMSPEYQERYIFAEVDRLERQVRREKAAAGIDLNEHALRERLARFKAQIQKADAQMRTPGEVYWDDLGFDYLLVDEVHRFKGLGIKSHLAYSQSKIKALDLHQKLDSLHAQRDGKPVCTLATGTPLTNSIAEEHTLLRYAAPWILKEYGCEGFDEWAALYGRTKVRLEMAPDGSGVRLVERFSEFVNQTAMSTMWRLVADVKTAEEVGIKRPAIVGGRPQLKLIEASAEQRELLQTLVARGQAYHNGDVDKTEDNPLDIANDGRAYALDPRLRIKTSKGGGKLVAAADLLAEHYHAHKDDVFAVSTENSALHPNTGDLQIVFMNQGTPGGKNKGQFDAYAELRRLCVERGVPEERVAFVHDGNQKPEQLAELFRKCRDGEISVIIGSTETMGTGANIQNRAAVLLHMDPDWRPSDMEQRNGRILRQGNQHEEVEIAFLATEGSMDAWQVGLLVAKAEGLRVAMSPNAGDGQILELDEAEWDWASMAAEIGGNPYIRDMFSARDLLTSLEADRRNSAVARLTQVELLEKKTAEAAATRDAITRRAEALPKIRPVKGDDFAMRIGGALYTRHKDAAPVLRQAAANVLVDGATPAGQWRVLGQLGGLDVAARATTDQESGAPQLEVGFPDLRQSESAYTVQELGQAAVGGRMIRSLVSGLGAADQVQAADHERLPGLDQEVADLQGQQDAVDFEPAIAHARRRLELLDDLVGTVAELDKLPLLRLQDIDEVDKHGTPRPLARRETMVKERIELRKPLEAKVAAAAARLEEFEANNPAPPVPETPGRRAATLDPSISTTTAAASAPATPTEPASGTVSTVGEMSPADMVAHEAAAMVAMMGGSAQVVSEDQWIGGVAADEPPPIAGLSMDAQPAVVPRPSQEVRAPDLATDDQPKSSTDAPGPDSEAAPEPASGALQELIAGFDERMTIGQIGPRAAAAEADAPLETEDESALASEDEQAAETLDERLLPEHLAEQATDQQAQADTQQAGTAHLEPVREPTPEPDATFSTTEPGRERLMVQQGSLFGFEDETPASVERQTGGVVDGGTAQGTLFTDIDEPATSDTPESRPILTLEGATAVERDGHRAVIVFNDSGRPDQTGRYWVNCECPEGQEGGIVTRDTEGKSPWGRRKADAYRLFLWHADGERGEAPADSVSTGTIDLTPARHLNTPFPGEELNLAKGKPGRWDYLGALITLDSGLYSTVYQDQSIFGLDLADVADEMNRLYETAAANDDTPAAPELTANSSAELEAVGVNTGSSSPLPIEAGAVHEGPGDELMDPRSTPAADEQLADPGTAVATVAAPPLTDTLNPSHEENVRKLRNELAAADRLLSEAQDRGEDTTEARARLEAVRAVLGAAAIAQHEATEIAEGRVPFRRGDQVTIAGEMGVWVVTAAAQGKGVWQVKPLGAAEDDPPHEFKWTLLASVDRDEQRAEDRELPVVQQDSAQFTDSNEKHPAVPGSDPVQAAAQQETASFREGTTVATESTTGPIPQGSGYEPSLFDDVPDGTPEEDPEFDHDEMTRAEEEFLEQLADQDAEQAGMEPTLPEQAASNDEAAVGQTDEQAITDSAEAEKSDAAVDQYAGLEVEEVPTAGPQPSVAAVEATVELPAAEQPEAEVGPAEGTTALDDVNNIFGRYKAYLAEVVPADRLEQVYAVVDGHAEALARLHEELGSGEADPVPATFKPPAEAELNTATFVKGAYADAKKYMAEYYSDSGDWKQLGKVWTGPGRIQKAVKDATGEKFEQVKQDSRWKRGFDKIAAITLDAVSRGAAKLARGLEIADRVAYKLLGKLSVGAANHAAKLRGEAPAAQMPVPAEAASEIARDQAELASRGLPDGSNVIGSVVVPRSPEPQLPKAPALAERGSGAGI